jgi:CheY-like chemotaxis protein
MPNEPPLIMVVDDDVDFLDLNRTVLEKAGYRVACFVDPGEALARMASDRPDLVITDLMMASLDRGFSFSRQIKDDPRYRDVPIIVVTAAGSQRGFDFAPRTPEDLAAMRVDAFFSKPLVPKTLVSKIELLLARRASSREEMP